ncbi:MAG TPA: RteC domain-containing protein [Puia sp.]|nr:RteC domain-containing protein [Puia sp.]
MWADHLKPLRVSIEETLTAQSSEGDALGCYKRCMGLAEEAIAQIRAELLSDPFVDKVSEISFYKEEAPWVWGYYLYYSRLVEIEVWRKVRSPERFRELLQKELRLAEVYAEEHVVCEYYYRGLSGVDGTYFTRGGSGEAMEMFLDRDMPTGTYELAWMRAYELLRVWLAEEMEMLEYKSLGLEQRRKLECALAPMEAIELFKGLHEAKIFKDWTFKRVMFWVGENMGIAVTNYNSLLQDLVRRKTNPTVFLNKVTEALETFMKKRV